MLNIFHKLLFKIGLLKHGYFIEKNIHPFMLREGSKKSIWLITSSFLFKLSLKPKIVRKTNLTNYTPQCIQIIYNRIKPRCWDIIEHSIRQKKFSEKKNCYFPEIDIQNYEISYKHYNCLAFYEYNSSIIVELDKYKSGGFGHLMMEVFPMLVYLSLKLPLKISTKGLNFEKSIYESFVKAYSIKLADPSDSLNGVKLTRDQIIIKYGLKVSSINSKYEYPNYNNICLMLSKLPKTNVQVNHSKFIYVGRKASSSNGRKLNKEDELLLKLISLGFDKVYPEDYSFQEQIKMFSNASIVVGAHGSAMLNSIFCNKSSHIIELCPDIDFRPGIWLSVVISESKYHFFPGPSKGKIVDGKPEQFDIDTSLVIKKVEDIININSL